jgi:hypothetical protein
VHGLALRWLSYVSSRFEITEGLLVTLQELLPVRDYGSILEGLMWNAAFRADGTSFERGLANVIGRGALGRRLGLLSPLAQGDLTTFSRTIEAGLKESPSETLRFLDQLVQRLELEESSVRRLQSPTLRRLRTLLEPLADPTSDARQGRRAAELQRRTLAIQQGLGEAGPESVRDQARVLAPGSEVFAGSVRLAPSDALPWPFEPAEVAPPSAFTPLELRPVEWRNLDGDAYLGWSIGG